MAQKRKNKEKLKPKPSSSEITVQAIVRKRQSSRKKWNYGGRICETGKF